MLFMLAYPFLCWDARIKKYNEEAVKLTNEVLDQIIYSRYFQHCFEYDEKIEKLHVDFLNGRLDESTYYKIGDSLKSKRRNTLPKCTLDYTDELLISNDEHYKFSLEDNLKDTFLINHFKNIPIELMIGTLSQSSELEVSDLNISYLQIVPHLKKKNRPWGEGMGSIAISRVLFNEQSDKAILFYEFICGPKCGYGEIVFITRFGDKYKVTGYKNVWIL